MPHKQFTFAKLWIMFARFEVRQLRLDAARKILGAAIGMCPKEALFKGYIQIEFDVSVREYLICFLKMLSRGISFESSTACGRCTRSG